MNLNVKKKRKRKKLSASSRSDSEVSPPITPLHSPLPTTSNDDDTRSWQEKFLRLMEEKSASDIKDLKGYSLDFDKFSVVLPQCVAAGTVSQADCDYVLHGLQYGFDLHVDETLLPGKYVTRNYKSAFEAKEKIQDALSKRVKTGKTLKLGTFNGKARDLPGRTGRTVPQGGVPKKLEPESIRPFSDHTKSGFNFACDISSLAHSLNTYDEISKELKPKYFMRIEDVDGAYPILPLSPKIWKYMYVWWYDVDVPISEQVAPNTLYAHVFGDFGTAAMPGVWDRFFRCVKAMAVLDGVLTLPMPHYVDDNSLIGPVMHLVNEEALKLGVYMGALGVPFKDLKSRTAAMVQLVLGFWWDSKLRTRTLEKEKLDVYLSMLRDYSRKRVFTLHELQVLIGRVHRAVMTMAPGATIFLSRLIAMTRGLTMPWHRRRVTAGARDDIKAIIKALEFNSGRGYFDYDHLPWAPEVWTDAMKDAHYAAWGWVSADGQFNFGKFGSSSSHKPIDFLEGDAVLRAARSLGGGWRGKRVLIHIDNSAFQLSFKKGRSKVERLNVLLRSLHLLAAQFDCIFVPVWISTHDNVGADALSRSRFDEFDAWFAAACPGVRSHRWCNARVLGADQAGAQQQA